jgi:hypothetical protein
MMTKIKEQLVRTIVFGLRVVLVLGALGLVGVSCSSQERSVPAEASLTVPQTVTQMPAPTHTPIPVSEGASASPEATHTPTPATPSATPTPTTIPTSGLSPTPLPIPPMTKREQDVLEEMQHTPKGAASASECGEILETQNWCHVYWHARQITYPEWETLFPWAVFYLVKYDRYGGEFNEHHNQLIIEDWGERLSRDDFHRLLGANHIFVTNENRETVARAFVLISLPDYLDEEIVFSDWEEGSWSAGLGFYYNYKIKSWTKIQGIKYQWYFIFDEEGLLSGVGDVIEYGIGDYVDVPHEELPPPSYLTLEYWRK